MISAIVLAAGESRRMGRTKQLLEWGGKPLLGHILETLRTSPVDETILVLGHEALRVLEKVTVRGVKVVVNPDYRLGMSTSLRQGLLAMDPGAEAFLVVLGDQPAITPEIIGLLVESYGKARPGKSIVVPTHLGRRGHPVLFHRKHREGFLGLTGDLGGRRILEENPQDILAVEAGTDAVVIDLDTPEDYSRHWGRGRP